MSHSLEFEIKGLPKLPNQTLYRHWRVKQQEALKWKVLVVNAVNCVNLEQKRTAQPFSMAKVTLTRLSSKEPDADNLMSSWKHCIDGLVLAGVIVNDKPSVIGTPVSRWEFAKRKDARVRIRVEEVLSLDKAV